MRILAIDTAHGACSVSLLEDNIIISQKIDNEQSRQAEYLFAIIDVTLKEQSLTYKDISAIAVNVGPGSFTGVRIGLAAVRGIALAAKIPVIGVTGFEALVLQVKQHSRLENILVVFDAKRGQVFAQYFSKGQRSEELMLEYNSLDIVLNKLDNFTIVGDGVDLIIPLLQAKQLNYSVIEALKLPDSNMIAFVAYQKITNGENIGHSAPLYIRPPDAKLPKK